MTLESSRVLPGLHWLTSALRWYSLPAADGFPAQFLHAHLDSKDGAAPYAVRPPVRCSDPRNMNIKIRLAIRMAASLELMIVTR